MIETLAVASYRSLRELIAPLGQLNLITGPNASGKSNLYRALCLLAETAHGGARRPRDPGLGGLPRRAPDLGSGGGAKLPIHPPGEGSRRDSHPRARPSGPGAVALAGAVTGGGAPWRTGTE